LPHFIIRFSTVPVLGAVGQYDKSQIVARLRGARMRARAKAKDGRCEGRKPFGYYEGENAVLARMTALRAEGLAFDRIAVRLNADGVPTRTAGKQWHGFGESDSQRHESAGP
jgi:hypothetical protein